MSSVDLSSTLVTTIDLLRHGHCDDGEIFRGKTDSALSAAGWQQMQRAIDNHHSSDFPWQAIISSPLQRCHKFAQHLQPSTNATLASKADFSEIDFGDWDGNLIAEIHSKKAEQLQRFWQTPGSVTPPNGETLKDFHHRVTDQWQKLISDHQGERVLLITHSGVIRTILALSLNAPLASMQRFSVPYGCMSQIKIFHHNHHPDWVQLMHHSPLSLFATASGAEEI